MATKQEILKDKLADYLAADKAGKGQLLDYLSAVTGMHRLAISRRLNTLSRRDPAWRPGHRGRAELYGPSVTVALRELWELSGFICGERLHPQMPEYVAQLKKFQEWKHGRETTARLLAMSLGTVKKRTLSFAGTGQQEGVAATKPSKLKELVPIRQGPWQNPKPGYGEVDTVAHCGGSLGGDYCYTVQYTDVSVIWTLLAAQWNKGGRAMSQNLEKMRVRSPFPLRGFDFDSGTEFINHEVVRWNQDLAEPLELSRSRPYRKNDHGRIEQKQYANIRRFVGYVRYDRAEHVAMLNELYGYLEDYLNFFVPSMKCLEKLKVGSKYRRQYDLAQTAYQRVLAHPDIDARVKEKLRAKYATLNLKTLKTAIERLQIKLINSARKQKTELKLQ